MVQYWLDNEDRLWTFAEEDDGQQVLESDLGVLLRSTVEKFHGPLTPLFIEEDVRVAFRAGAAHESDSRTQTPQGASPDEDAFVAQLSG